MSKPGKDVYRAAATELVKWNTSRGPTTGREFTEAVNNAARTPRLRRIVDVVWKAALARRPTPPAPATPTPADPPPPKIQPTDGMQRLTWYLRRNYPNREFTDPVDEITHIVDSLNEILDDAARGGPPPTVASRGSAVEEWLTWQRDNRPADSIEWGVLNDLLHDYRSLADRGRPLTARTSGADAVLSRAGGVALFDVYQVAYRAAYRAVLPFVDRREVAVYVCDRIVPGVVGTAHNQPLWCRRAVQDGVEGERSRWRAVSQARFRSVAVMVPREAIDAALVAMAQGLLEAAEDAAEDAAEEGDGDDDEDGKVNP